MKRAIFFLCLILVADALIMHHDWYFRHLWIDIPFHILGGFFIAMLFSDYLKNHLRPNSYIKNMLIIVGTTVFIAVIWEFMEYSSSQLLIWPIYKYIYIGDLNDTIKDLFNGTLGGITYVLLWLSPLNRHKV